MSLKIRIIPCLDVNDGRVVKGINFRRPARRRRSRRGRRALTTPQGADELCFLDITASHESRDIMFDVVRATAEQCFMPLTVGGGMRTLEDIRELLKAGADKVSINTAAVNDAGIRAPRRADKFGAQCIVVAIDAKRVPDPASRPAGRSSRMAAARPPASTPSPVPRTSVELGAGEILLTSMDRDGTKSGFDLGADARRH